MFGTSRINKDIAYKAAIEVFKVVITVAITVFILTQFFYKPVVVLDIKKVVQLQRDKASKMEENEAIQYVGNYFDRFSQDITKRNEIVLVKEAVINSERFKDITNEYLQ